MDLEQQLRESYAERLDTLVSSAADVGAARRAGARLKVRRRLAVGVAAVAVVAVAVAGHGLLDRGPVSTGPSHAVGEWRVLPPAPLSPRALAASVWTGREVVVVGGQSDPCPPNTDGCVGDLRDLRDGAAYDPATNAWRRIAKAPVPVTDADGLVAAGGKVVLRHYEGRGWGWFVYDPGSDRWSGDLGGPPLRSGAWSALGSKVFGIAGRHVVSYDVGSGLWTRLPVDPNLPLLAHRQVTATPAGTVLSGYDATRPDDGTVPSVVLADVYDGTRWRRLPATGQLGNGWFWNGSRMVVADPTKVDGGQVNPFPRAYPEGGLLDPSTGRWSPLAPAFAEASSGWGVYAAGGRWAAAYGQVYDTQTGRVTLLPRPAADAPDEGVSAVWADGVLVAFGGVHSTGAADGSTTNTAWLYTP